MSPEHIYAPYQGSRGIDIHPVDYQVRQCKTSADRGEDALADLEVDAKAPLHPSPPPKTIFGYRIVWKNQGVGYTIR